MTGFLSLKEKLLQVFSEPQAEVLAEVLTAAYADLVRASDFNELKEITRELAEAQRQTEQHMGQLEQRMGELAEAQRQTEQRMIELADEVAKTQRAMQRLAEVQQGTREELGGLARSVSYSLENEAFRALPAYLRARHGIELTQRFIRTEMEGEEINLFGLGRKNGVEVVVVGESELRANSIRKLRVLERKAKVVGRLYKGELVKLLVTHYATPRVQQKASEMGILVVQSFEWQ